MTSHKKDSHTLPNVGGKASLGPRHSLGFRVSHRVRSGIAIVLCALVAFTASFISAAAIETMGIINIVQIPKRPNEKQREPEDIYKGKALNILVLGQDTREGAGNEAIGGGAPDEAGNHQSDTAMVAQISADRTYINLVPIPRDSMVNAPACVTSKGDTIAARRYVMFNSIFALGYQEGGDIASAASCSLTAVNTLTGLDIQQFVVADFNGMKDMIDALGGVDICIPVNTQDDYTGLDLRKGLQHLDGTSATQYARMRHGTGTDGSDIMRTTRQQYLVKTLMNEAHSKEVYSNFGKLYQLAKTSLSALQLSEGLGNLGTLYGLADSLKNIDSTHIYSRTLPVDPDPNNPKARVVWAKGAQDVWETLKAEKPLTDDHMYKDNAADPSASATENAQTSEQDGTQAPSSTPAQPAPDPKTGLIEQNGQLIDPVTGGIVDPEDGSIRDANSGQYIGIADRYLSATVCAVPAQK
ncbi:transcriptional regulator [Bombiscardovia nodaiensis]|uniref:Transcriptional regulator n=1 Tax=Bombiscardovia nodaiensis TaxID=2932181 RepID=A0ABN6SCN8_9BIFI|nr:transcriptional regulator [Bombiscardovia nodaiensis]